LNSGQDAFGYLRHAPYSNGGRWPPKLNRSAERLFLDSKTVPGKSGNFLRRAELKLE
jgi:hypothetical protein